MKLILFTIISLIFLTTVIAENPVTLELVEGKNNFTIEEYFPPIQIKSLMLNNPEISSASVIEYGKTFGYVNAFEGIGTNFLIESGREYEIYVNKSVTINLKE